jgi:hypothetical protein
MAPVRSIIANRKDKANQPFWTEYRIPAVDGCCPAEPGAVVLLGPDCKIDPCLMPPVPSGLVIEINGVPSPCQDILNFIPGTGITITYSPDCGYIFTATGTPTECGNAAFLCTDIVGTHVEVDISHPTHPGQLLISQPGNTSAIWTDPQVQGLYAAGSTICPAPAYVAPTCIQPILIGGADCNGVLQNVEVTTGGKLITVAQDQETDINVLRFAATTGPILKPNTTPNLLPLLSIRPVGSATGVTFTFRSMDFLNNGNLSHYQLLLNATLTGATFAAPSSSTNMTVDIAATGYSGGRLIDAGYIGADHERNEHEFHFGFAGATPDTITLVYVGSIVGGTSGVQKSNAGCSFAWDEQATCL